MKKYRVRKYFVYVVMGNSNIPIRSYLSGEFVDPKDIGDPEKNEQMNRLEEVEDDGATETAPVLGKESKNESSGEGDTDGAGTIEISSIPQDGLQDTDRRKAAIAKLSKANGALN